MKTNIETLIRSARAKEIRHRNHSSKPKTLLTGEEIKIIRAMVKEDVNHSAIFETLKENNMTKYTSFPGWRTACKKALKTR